MVKSITSSVDECEKIKVIVVDDYEDQRESLVDLLSVHDITVVGTGSDGKEAFELYGIHRPDVVLLDVMMPHYDGFYALSRIRAFDPDAPIVFISGNIDMTKINDPHKTFFIQKPIRINDLLVLISGIMKSV